jgi:hypothetical protein
MESLVRNASELLARTSRRTFIARTLGTLAGFTAGVAAGATHVINVEACGCGFPCGQACSSYVSGSCNWLSGCAGSCSPNYSDWGTTNCWADGCGYECCDCWCPGSLGSSSCWSQGSFACGCRVSGTAPGLGSLQVLSPVEVSDRRARLRGLGQS